MFFLSQNYSNPLPLKRERFRFQKNAVGVKLEGVIFIPINRKSR
nr:MAG TPA: hypothetical protein [Caudoviricetes sp.]